MQNVTFSALSDFYATGTGQRCMSLLHRQVRVFWPDLTAGQKVLGVGYASPCLRAWPGLQMNPVSVVLPHYDSVKRGGAGLRDSMVHTLVGEAGVLPFQSESFDRVVLMHAFQTQRQAVRLLREAAQVLRDDGRMILIFPAALTGRSRLKHTPFARELAFSSYTIKRLLDLACLKAERQEKMFFLPLTWECKNAHINFVSDIAGKMFVPGLGSLCVIEVVKNINASLTLPLPVWQRRWRRYISHRPAFLRSFIR